MVTQQVIDLSQSSNLSITEACGQIAKEIGVSAKTLHRRVYRLMEARKKQHGNQLLTDHEENQLVAFLRVLGRNGMGWNRQQIINFVRDVVGKDAKWSGWRFVDGFLKRHADLIVPRNPKPSDIQRLRVKMSDIERFIETAGSVLSTWKGSKDHIINVDETFAMSQHIRHPAVVVPTEAVRACISKEGFESLRAIVPFLGAGGRVWLVVLIFKKAPDVKGKPILADLLSNRTPRSYAMFVATTKNGLVTKKLWQSIIEKFVAIIKPHLGPAGALLLLDHLVSHEDGPSLRLLRENNINSFYFIPHASHILQPADNVAFALLKRTIYEKVHSLLQSYLAKKVGPRYLVQRIIIEAIRDSLTESTIRASFKNTGMFPFDGQLIRANAAAQLGTDDEPHTPVIPPEILTMEKHIEAIFTRHETPSKSKMVGIEKEEVVISLDELIAAQDAKAAAKEREEEEAQVKANEKKRKQVERKEKEDTKRAARKFCGECNKKYRNGRTWKECPVCTSALFCPDCIQTGYAAAHEKGCGPIIDE